MNDDLKLQQRVIDELDFEPVVDAAHIGVSVRDGVVTLSGHVGSYIEKYEAERAARRVRGVRAVAQELTVELPNDKKTADDEIAARALKLLNWDGLVPDDRLSLRVEHGIVTLGGEVDWRYQRDEAESDMRKLGGVKGVINNIRVRPGADPDDVSVRIRDALERNADLEADGITVEVSGGLVTLRGRVAARAERDAVERAVWSTPGVSQVMDHLEIVRQ